MSSASASNSAGGGASSSSSQQNANDKAPSNGNSGVANNYYDEALRRMYKLVNGFLSKADCSPFAEPVDWRGLELWDYPKIIKKMMDLGTVKRKLDRGQYQTAHECAEDIRLIWKNCMTYNADGSDFFLLAENFSKKFEDRYKKIQAECDTGSDDGKGASGRSGGEKGGSPSLETRVKFGANLLSLSGIELGHVLQVLDLRCPQAIERPSNGVPGPSINNAGDGVVPTEELEINVDVIDTRTFLELDQYVKEKLFRRGGKNASIDDRLNTRNTSGTKKGINKRKR